MRYVVTVTRYGYEHYAYGPFETKRDACNWAEQALKGFDWHVAQYIVVQHIS